MTATTPVMIMAGGKGSRLGPLTCHRSKPAVPFAGRYRIIDIVLSNCVNSGYRQVYVLTQFMASSLLRHIGHTWQLSGFGEYIETVPAQMRRGEFWYRGTADAVYQNLHLIDRARAEHAIVLAGDHVCKLAVDQMEAAHRDRAADLTVAAFPVPRDTAHEFGIIRVDARGRITGFQEKPADPEPMPGRPDTCLASMGNYVFRTDTLRDALGDGDGAGREDGQHDFGRNVIPRLVRDGAKVCVYDFADNSVPGEPDDAEPYWRDVGSIDSYFAATMDVRSELPRLNLYNRSWPIRTAMRHFPPARFVRPEGCSGASDILNSLVCEGSIVSSATLERALVGYDCFVHAGSVVEESVLFSGCDVGAGAHLRRVLLDKNCSIDRGARIGLDPDADLQRFPFISPAGVVVLPKGTHVPEEGPIRLAHDVAEILSANSATKDALAAFEGRFEVCERGRWSNESAGPRYRRFGPRSLSSMDGPPSDGL